MMKTKYQELRDTLAGLLERENAKNAPLLVWQVQNASDETIEAWLAYDYHMTPDEMLEKIKEVLRQ